METSTSTPRLQLILELGIMAWNGCIMNVTVVEHREDLFKKRRIWFINDDSSCFVSYFTAGEKATVRFF